MTERWAKAQDNTYALTTTLPRAVPLDNATKFQVIPMADNQSPMTMFRTYAGDPLVLPSLDFPNAICQFPLSQASVVSQV